MLNYQGESIRAINLQTKKLPKNKLLKVYSRERGLLLLSGNKLGGRSEPFVENIFTVKFSNRSDIHTIQASDFQLHFKNILLDYNHLSIAWNFAELLESFSHSDDVHSPELFDLFYISLDSLNQAEYYQEDKSLLILLKFLWNFIVFIGYKPDFKILDNYLGQEKILYFDLEEGELIAHKPEDSINNNYSYIDILPKVQQAFSYLLASEYSNLNISLQKFCISILLRYLQNKAEKVFKTSSAIYELLS